MLVETVEAWDRILDKDKRRNSTPAYKRSVSPPARHYSQDEIDALRNKHQNLFQLYNFCDKQAVACKQTLKCCQDAISEADLPDCLKNFEKN